MEPTTSTRTGASGSPARVSVSGAIEHGAAERLGRLGGRRRRRAAARSRRRRISPQDRGTSCVVACGCHPHAGPVVPGGRPAPQPIPSPSAMHVVIVGAGTFGASLAWWLARAGDDGDAGRPVRARRPARDRPAGSRGCCAARTAPHADYTASARRARTLWRELEAESGEDLYLECGLTWFAQRDDALGGAERPRPRRAGDPVPAARARRGRAALPHLGSGGPALPPARAGGRRRARPARGAGAGAPGGGATARRSLRGRATPDGATARLEDGRVLDGRRRRLGLRRPGCPSSSRSTCPSAPCSPSCSSSTAARPGATRRSPPSSISTPRSTARTTSTGSA